jgi:hypothetical protein
MQPYSFPHVTEQANGCRRHISGTGFDMWTAGRIEELLSVALWQQRLCDSVSTRACLFATAFAPMPPEWKTVNSCSLHE